MRNITLPRRIIAAYDNQQLYCLQTTNVVNSLNGVELSIKYVLGILNSSLVNWFFKASFPSNNHIASSQLAQIPVYKINFSNSGEVRQHQLVVTLVDYILFLRTNASEGESRDQLMVSYFEQIIDALVYELYLPDVIHGAGREFFAPLIAERLPALDEIKGDKLAKLNALRQIFERLFHKDHLIRQNIFFLDTIESIRIIEGKA